MAGASEPTRPQGPVQSGAVVARCWSWCVRSCCGIGPDRAGAQPHPPVRRDAPAERHPDEGRPAHRPPGPGAKVHSSRS